MSAPTVDTDLVGRICCQAAGSHPNAGTVVTDVVRDPLDGSVWVYLWPPASARHALAALHAHGLTGRDLHDGRLQVTRWDVSRLRRRLAVLLAGVDDLTSEWDATAELVRYYHDRRVAAGVDADLVDVLADVETVMRASVPFPHHAPAIDDVDSLLHLITAAEDAYQQLIAAHLDYAEHVLAVHTTGHVDAAHAGEVATSPAPHSTVANGWSSGPQTGRI